MLTPSFSVLALLHFETGGVLYGDVGILCVSLFNNANVIPLVRNCAQIRSVNVWLQSVQSYRSKLPALWTQH